MLRLWSSALFAFVFVGVFLAADSASARWRIATRYDPRLWAATEQSLGGQYDYRREYDYVWSVRPVRPFAPAAQSSAVAAPPTVAEPQEPVVAPQPPSVKSPRPQTNSK